VKRRRREEMQKILVFLSLKTDVVVVLPEASLRQLESPVPACQTSQCVATSLWAVQSSHVRKGRDG